MSTTVGSVLEGSNRYNRAAWRGMASALRVSERDMYALLGELHGINQRHVLALRDATSVVDAWTTTKKVLRLAAQWRWVHQQWPYLTPARLEPWITDKDAALGLWDETVAPMRHVHERVAKRKAEERIRQQEEDDEEGVADDAREWPEERWRVAHESLLALAAACEAAAAVVALCDRRGMK